MLAARLRRSPHTAMPFATHLLTPRPACTSLPQDGAPRSPVYFLDAGGSESLRVVPASKRLSFVQLGSSAVGSERHGATINLHFEGNWMPVVVSGGAGGGREEGLLNGSVDC